MSGTAKKELRMELEQEVRQEAFGSARAEFKDEMYKQSHRYIMARFTSMMPS